MGDIADMVIDGAMCQMCGMCFDDEPVGYPVTCEACQSSEEDDSEPINNSNDDNA